MAESDPKRTFRRRSQATDSPVVGAIAAGAFAASNSASVKRGVMCCGEFQSKPPGRETRGRFRGRVANARYSGSKSTRFDAAVRQLEGHVRRMRGDIKSHTP